MTCATPLLKTSIKKLETFKKLIIQRTCKVFGDCSKFFDLIMMYMYPQPQTNSTSLRFHYNIVVCVDSSVVDCMEVCHKFIEGPLRLTCIHVVELLCVSSSAPTNTVT